MILSKKRITKALIRLRVCAGWSALLLFVNHRRQVFSRRGPIVLWLFMFCIISLRGCRLVCSLWLWHFLVILTYFFWTNKNLLWSTVDLEKLYISFILPLFEYCDCIFENYSVEITKTLSTTRPPELFQMEQNNARIQMGDWGPDTPEEIVKLYVTWGILVRTPTPWKIKKAIGFSVNWYGPLLENHKVPSQHFTLNMYVGPSSARQQN